MRRTNPLNQISRRLWTIKRFVFSAQSANPMRGRTVHLSPGYTIKVSADTVIAIFPTMEEPIQHP